MTANCDSTVTAFFAVTDSLPSLFLKNPNLHRSYFLAVRKHLFSRLRNFGFSLLKLKFQAEETNLELAFLFYEHFERLYLGSNQYISFISAALQFNAC